MKQCQLCNAKNNVTIYDARLPSGQWAWMCHACFIANGCKLGTGHGQKFRLDVDGKLTKIAG